MADDSSLESTQRQKLAWWIRGARLHAPRGQSDDFYDGWDAGLRRLMIETFTEGSIEVRSFDVLPPVKGGAQPEAALEVARCSIRSGPIDAVKAEGRGLGATQPVVPSCSWRN